MISTQAAQVLGEAGAGARTASLSFTSKVTSSNIELVSHRELECRGEVVIDWKLRLEVTPSGIQNSSVQIVSVRGRLEVWPLVGRAPLRRVEIDYSESNAASAHDLSSDPDLDVKGALMDASTWSVSAEYNPKSSSLYRFGISDITIALDEEHITISFS